MLATEMVDFEAHSWVDDADDRRFVTLVGSSNSDAVCELQYAVSRRLWGSNTKILAEHLDDVRLVTGHTYQLAVSLDIVRDISLEQWTALETYCEGYLDGRQYC